MNCPRCGATELDPSVRFCRTCGASLPAAAPPSPLETLPPGAGDEAHCALHPEAKATDICHRCGAFGCARCIHPDAQGRPLCDSCFAREGANVWEIPWEKRRELGRFKAFWETTRATLSTPTVSYAGLQPSTGRWWDPLSYAIVSGYLEASGTLLAYLAFGGALGAIFFSFAKLNDVSGGIIALIGVAIVAGFIIIVPIAMLFRVFVMSGVEHLLLSLFGGVSASFEGTLRAHCYAMGPSVLGLIPFCGTYAVFIWEAVLRIFALRSVHRTTGGKAAAAVLTPFGFCCVLYAFGMIAGQMASLFLNNR